MLFKRIGRFLKKTSNSVPKWKPLKSARNDAAFRKIILCRKYSHEVFYRSTTCSSGQRSVLPINAAKRAQKGSRGASVERCRSMERAELRRRRYLSWMESPAEPPQEPALGGGGTPTQHRHRRAPRPVGLMSGCMEVLRR